MTIYKYKLDLNIFTGYFEDMHLYVVKLSEGCFVIILNVTYQIGNCHLVLEEICSSHGLPICQHASISQEGDTSFS